MNIEDTAKECYRTAVSKGFWETFDGTPEHIASKLALIHSEVSEALESLREHYPPKTSADTNERGKPIGFASELADIVIRVFDLSEGLGINIADEIKAKMAYNQSREKMHGGKAI